MLFCYCMEKPLMSSKSWQESLSQTIKRLTKPDNDSPPRIAVLGVGQAIRGDDGAGVLLAQRLEALGGHSGLLAVDGGPAPENFTGLLRRFQPDLVLLADAALMD